MPEKLEKTFEEKYNNKKAENIIQQNPPNFQITFTP